MVRFWLILNLGNITVIYYWIKLLNLFHGRRRWARTPSAGFLLSFRARRTSGCSRAPSEAGCKSPAPRTTNSGENIFIFCLHVNKNAYVRVKDAGFVYESFQNKTNRVIWKKNFTKRIHETNLLNTVVRNESTKRIFWTPYRFANPNPKDSYGFINL